ncbi:TetR/AcrR family transcriptional regulator [Prauserella endophytica]|uniref:Helix-turn-helix transcriptional regulator n=1 Tax=Prauserella endophytica TaxID=1592324 RepID=A0ABY2RWA0_9PSEU|nr:TetR/AcrR family transcriptional regulator [Prauserella endophytica]TKG61852.1 helix-turn-helix transcriptional regulator [Prauserella endophytica]
MSDQGDGQAPRKRGRPTREERARRQEEILDAAVGLFVSNGFHAVSLDDVAGSAHVTKRTLYAYFGDKSEIFFAAVARLRRRALEMTGRRCDTPAQLATEIVVALHSDEAIGLHRLMITEAHSFPDLAKRFYDEGPRSYIAALEGLLPEADAGRATALFSLLLGEPHRQRLLGLRPAPTRAQARAQAVAALEALGLEAR